MCFFIFFCNILTTIVEALYFSKKTGMIRLGDEKMRVDFVINELLKKVEYANIWVDTINLKELDKKSIYRL